MANPGSFLDTTREDPPKRPHDERLNDYREEELPLSKEKLEEQAARCMDCGIPFCQVSGCPLRNRIPDWCLMAAGGNWRGALESLHSTNNFPEITGRVCPAPCEPVCTLSINLSAVTVKHIELQIAEYGWDNGLIVPETAENKTGKKIAVIGSGPAGLVSAQQLARHGHDVTVFEKDDRIGGILRYGIPDFILEKHNIDRRIEQMIAEGVRFEAGVNAGIDLSARYIQRSFDAVIIAVGTQTPLDIAVEGRTLSGIAFAMDFLTQQNRRNAGDTISPAGEITAQGKDVVIIGSGYTGFYCAGTCRRQGAKSIKIVDIEPDTSVESSGAVTWPESFRGKNTPPFDSEGYSLLDGVEIKSFRGEQNKVHSVVLQKSGSGKNGNRSAKSHNMPAEEFEVNAGLVLIAAGFSRSGHNPLIGNLSPANGKSGKIQVDSNGMTTFDSVFASGNCVYGPSSVVHAMYHGRRVAESVDRYLTRVVT